MNHPQRLGKYQITGVLGEGAMGVVYRGFDPDIRRVVALKTIRHQGGADAQSAADSAARFRNEAQAAGRLLHPGIVGVYDFGDDGRVAFIAMEYVEGHTLAQYLARQVPFSDADIASLATQLLQALGHAHEHGVWHRDIKPSNVIMTKTGRVKIADFGIARTENSALTMAGSVLGTPMYMAPEQFMGHSVDHRVDLYGVGVLLYQVVAGRPPFVGAPESLMYKVVNELPQPPSRIEGRLRSERFDALVMRAIAKDPQARHASAAAFAEAVAQALGQPAPAEVGRETVYALPAASDYAPTERIVPAPTGLGAPPPTGSKAPAHWDPAVLAQVEAAMARHVGPLAGVLVRRAARESQDLDELHARLAPQITQTAAREAFLAQVARTATGGSGSGSGSRPGAGSGAGSGAGTNLGPPGHGSSRVGAGSGSTAFGGTQRGVPAGHTASMTDFSSAVSEAWLDQAGKLLAAHLGPIARVLVKRAAERSRQRQTLQTLLADAVPAAARGQVLDALSRLPP